MSIPKILTAKRKKLFFKLIVIGFTQAALAVMTALLIRFVFDHWITHQHNEFGQLVFFIVAALVLLASITALMRYGERVTAERLGQQYTYEVRLALFDQLVDIAPWTLQKRSRGGHLLRFIGDLTALRQWVSQGLATLTVALVTAVFALIALSFINAILAATVASVLLLGAGVSLASGQQIHDRVKDTRKFRARIAANVNEKIAYLPVVQVFNQTRRERSRLSRQSLRLKDAMINRAKIIGRLRGVTEASNGFATICVLFVGSFEVSQGRSTPGMVVASMSILGMLLPSFRNLGRIYEYWHSYQVALERINSFMDTAELIIDQAGATKLNVTQGKIDFHNINFNDIFNQLNGTIAGQTKLAIVGSNGTGKSTLMNMLLRLVDPDSGDIFIDDQNIKHCTLSSIRQTIGVVSPDLPLLRGSLERNLRYRYRKASVDELAQVCKLCGVDKVIAELPDGINTRIIDGGMNLSFGQRQRISLARAILGNPKILLLDEADANLDHTSKKLLDQILASFSGTVIMITHNYDRVSKADYIWHLADGGIVEKGTPNELLKQNGATSALFNFHLKAVV
ncbi:MAG: ABC transporter ATP-binding protein [Methylococcales bacterium]